MNPSDIPTSQLDRLRAFFLKTAADSKIPALSAAVIALVSLLGCHLMIYLSVRSVQIYVFGWGAAFVVCSAFTVFFYWINTFKLGEKPFSHKAQAIIMAMVPPLLVGAAMSCAAIIQPYHFYYITAWWIIFYSLALHAVAPFFSWTVRILAWAFLITGIAFAVLLALPIKSIPILWDIDTTRVAPWLMGWTFGLYHAIYAGCIWSMSSVPKPMGAVHRA